MQQTWRWFGPEDPVTLQHARQAGAEGIVTALHPIQPGEVWPLDHIQRRQEILAASGFKWSVVESLDISDSIKTRSADWQQHIASFQHSLCNLAQCGIKTVAYNLMPVFSWTRTHLRSPLPNGGNTLRFHALSFAAFDIHILRRKDAESDWGQVRSAGAHRLYHSLSRVQREELETTILRGLPGGNDPVTLQQLRVLLDHYGDVDSAALRANAAAFLKAVCPVAQELGVRLCVHPDDPPRPLLGLPRIVSTAADLEFLLAQSPEESNGITFCTGALGVRPDNDLVAMVRRFAPRIWFTHLRSTQREPALEPGLSEEEPMESFTEAAHLEGDADLVSIVAELLEEEMRRQTLGDSRPIPFRPDHGQQLFDDDARHGHPGYPAVGRLRGLAELRGVIRGTEKFLSPRKAAYDALQR